VCAQNLPNFLGSNASFVRVKHFLKRLLAWIMFKNTALEPLLKFILHLGVLNAYQISFQNSLSMLPPWGSLEWGGEERMEAWYRENRRIKITGCHQEKEETEVL
jgi:hypothetical protein